MTGSGCQQCGENTYSGSGASSCTSCPAGKLSNAGSSSVEDCRGNLRFMLNFYHWTTIIGFLLKFYLKRCRVHLGRIKRPFLNNSCKPCFTASTALQCSILIVSV